MPRKFQPFRVIRKNYRLFNKRLLLPIKKQLNWLLRTIFVNKTQRRGTANAGFVLPTVAMVILVVVLLTAAILFRSFDRAKNASNVRVNEAVLAAATPALDRARAKLDQVFTDPTLPRATPSDDALQNAFENNLTSYTFGDETNLQLQYTITNSDNTTTQQVIKTAWMYPTDTDNNGKYDTYTLYGIYFKTPPVNTSGNYTRARTPVEARTAPMTNGKLNSSCASGATTSASLVNTNGWVNITGKLEKSFFVYTTTVPITAQDITTTNLPSKYDSTKFESYTGNKAVSALEYQQDRVHLPLVNNAVVYDDDLEINPGPNFNLNGRIITNSNLLTYGSYVNDQETNRGVYFYQVSSPYSCFYDEDNARVTVGGNTVYGGFTGDPPGGNVQTTVHLFQGKGNAPTTSGNQISTNLTNNTLDIAYNSLAYVQRINRLVSAQMANSSSSDPTEVQTGIANETSQLGVTTLTTAQQTQIRQDQLSLYFKKRTRRVPYKEVAFGDNALNNTGTDYSTTSPLQGSGDSLRPIDTWVFPFNPGSTSTPDGSTGTNYTGLKLNPDPTGSGTKLIPAATEPQYQQQTNQGNEAYLGDRVLIGNNLPALWWDSSKNQFVGPGSQDIQNINNTAWDAHGATNELRYRRSEIQQLADLGSTDRDKDWEVAAAAVPTSTTDPIGGLRVITGAGIYLPSQLKIASSGGSTATDFANALTATNRIWSDIMPVASATATTVTTADSRGQSTSLNNNFKYSTISLPNSNTPYLRMRATAVYHYKQSSYSATNPKPIACVSSYYDPTNSITARNQTGLPDVSPLSSPADNTNSGNSNNGVTYSAPSKTSSDVTAQTSDPASTSNYAEVLYYQSQLRYPNGRLVNPLLQQALAVSSGNRTLSQQSAIDAELCALQILDGSITPVTSSPVIPHGTISETAYLDGRQIKAIHNDVTSGVETFTNADGVNGNGTGTVASVPTAANYDLPVEQRQPLEVRATVLDVGKLRTTTYGSSSSTSPQEYLLPNSGIIYATRNDALPDLSAPSTGTGNTPQTQQTTSPVDYILDPTRRPNAIMLINGSKICRASDQSSTTNCNTYTDVEKGLILASNIPAYVKGEFNLHTQEEFNATLASDWSNFYTRGNATTNDLNPNFACRKGDPRLTSCTTGDNWRPATVLADAVTLLSSNFNTGYRQDGDYDLNNNLGDGNSITTFKQNGFDSNAYVSNALWYNPSASDTTNGAKPKNPVSSYLNNFVTPVQRRANSNEYLMEVCLKLPVSQCNADTDWQIDPSSSTGTHSWDYNSGGGVIGVTLTSSMSTTATPASSMPYPSMYPRRVAFQRDSNGNVVHDPYVYNGNVYFGIALGIDSNGKIQKYTIGGGQHPRRKDNSLWFKTSDGGGNISLGADQNLRFRGLDTTNPKSQESLQPVLQITTPFGTPDALCNPSNNYNGYGSATPTCGDYSSMPWLQPAAATTFNLVSATGDTPGRNGEDNGGLTSLVRFLETWRPTYNSSTDTTLATKISGSFIQVKRSAYATAPFSTSLSSSSSDDAGNYQIATGRGRTPFFVPPQFQWGYDVGLLSQSPDFFAQKLVIIPDSPPNEYFREVGKDDSWVQQLLCATTDGTHNAINSNYRPSSCHA